MMMRIISLLSHIAKQHTNTKSKYLETWTQNRDMIHATPKKEKVERARESGSFKEYMRMLSSLCSIIRGCGDGIKFKK
jgi:hypothetical protein